MERQSALVHHPELAQLWTLHYAGRMGLAVLDHAPRVGPPQTLGRLRQAIGELLVAIEQYRSGVESQRAPVPITVPGTWTREQSAAVLELLHAVVAGVEATQEAGVVELGGSVARRQR